LAAQQWLHNEGCNLVANDGCFMMVQRWLQIGGTAIPA